MYESNTNVPSVNYKSFDYFFVLSKDKNKTDISVDYIIL